MLLGIDYETLMPLVGPIKVGTCTTGERGAHYLLAILLG